MPFRIRKHSLTGQKIILGLFIILFILTSTCYANSFSSLMFGPVDYVRSTGKPVDKLTNFSVVDPIGSFILRIQSPGGVSSATIMLNGVKIANPDSFKKNVVLLIDKQVLLREENTLSVKLNGKPSPSLING